MDKSTRKIFLVSVLGPMFSFILSSSVSSQTPFPFLLLKASQGVPPHPPLPQYLFPVCTAPSCTLLPFFSVHSSVYKRRQKGATIWTYSKGIISSCISFAFVTLPSPLEHALLASELQSLGPSASSVTQRKIATWLRDCGICSGTENSSATPANTFLLYVILVHSFNLQHFIYKAG